jgi:hypothetical protein
MRGLAVFGSADFADNQNFEGTYFNRDLFLNTVGWLGWTGRSALDSAARAARLARQLHGARGHRDFLPVGAAAAGAPPTPRSHRVVAARVMRSALSVPFRTCVFAAP